jgi:hypothetical protein
VAYAEGQVVVWLIDTQMIVMASLLKITTTDIREQVASKLNGTYLLDPMHHESLP